MYCYGADSMIESRLCKDEGSQPYLQSVKKQCQAWSIEGHRTLFVAMKYLTQQQWDAFNDQIEEIRGKPGFEDKRWDIVEKMETGLYGIGATCVEDKLQKNVPETIADLLKAGTII